MSLVTTGISTTRVSISKVASIYSRHVAPFNAAVQRALLAGAITPTQSADLLDFMDQAQTLIPTLTILTLRGQQGL